MRPSARLCHSTGRQQSEETNMSGNIGYEEGATGHTTCDSRTDALGRLVIVVVIVVVVVVVPTVARDQRVRIAVDHIHILQVVSLLKV